MKYITFFGMAAFAAMFTLLGATPAHALSCLSVDDYLKDVVGKEEVVIFTGTATEQIEKDNYTAEVIDVDEALQGYVEEELYVYHQKDEAWGYLCNNGPADEAGQDGLYVASRSDSGKINVHQRLELDDPLVETLRNDLAEAEIGGEVMEISKTDRMNQIKSTIASLIEEIKTLMQEYIYWMRQ